MKKLISMMMALMLCLIPITSYAEIKAAKEPSDMNKTPAELNGCTEEEWARLMDNKLEYDEIGKLVHYFNPSMSMAWNQLDDSIRDTKSSINLLSDPKKKTTGEFDPSLTTAYPNCYGYDENNPTDISLL